MGEANDVETNCIETQPQVSEKTLYGYKCNWDELNTADGRIDEDGFDITPVFPAEQDKFDDILYCKRWVSNSDLHIVQRELVQSAFNNTDGETRLMNLFLNSTVVECIRSWTSEVLKRGRRRSWHL